MFENAIKLDKRVSIYVPSTVNVDHEADNREMVNRVAEALAGMFGGSTVTEARGAWVSDTAGLVVESVSIVYSNCTQDQLDQYEKQIEALAVMVKTEMVQEAVSVEVDGALYLV